METGSKHGGLDTDFLQISKLCKRVRIERADGVVVDEEDFQVIDIAAEVLSSELRYFIAGEVESPRARVRVKAGRGDLREAEVPAGQAARRGIPSAGAGRGRGARQARQQKRSHLREEHTADVIFSCSITYEHTLICMHTHTHM